MRPKTDQPLKQVSFGLPQELIEAMNKARKHRPLSQVGREALEHIFLNHSETYENSPHAF